MIAPSLRSTELIREGRARAATARPSEDSTRDIEDKYVAMVNSAASSTLTASLLNATDVEEKATRLNRQTVRKGCNHP